MTVEPLLSPQEIADLVGISYHGVLRDIRSGKLKATAKGKGYKVEVAWYREWLEADYVNPHRPPRLTSPNRPRHRGPAIGKMSAAAYAIEVGNVGSVASLDAIERQERAR